MYTVAWQNKAEASHRYGMGCKPSEQEKKPILHAVDANQNGVTEWTFFSLDTDIFVLCLGLYPEFLRETIFVIGTGNRMGKFKFRRVF